MEFPKVKVTDDQLKRLWDGISDSHLADAQKNLPLPALELIYLSHDKKFQISSDKDHLLTIKGTASDESGKQCDWTYVEHENGNSEFTHPSDFEFDLQQVERIIEKVGYDYILIQALLLYPTSLSIQKEWKRKRKGTSQSRSGDDEELYRTLLGYQKNLGCCVSTGIGTKHSHEYDRKGHYRHYKSGKVVFIHSYTCCKGKGTKIQHEYVAEKVI